MTKLHAAFDRLWNGISLRTKITGVTVLLLTFGLAVAGAGTMTVLRTYLLDRVDATVNANYQDALQMLNASPEAILDCQLPYNNRGYMVAILAPDGSTVCDNIPDEALHPDLSFMTLSWSYARDGAAPFTITDTTHQGQWKVKTSLLSIGGGSSYLTMAVGVDLADVDNTITRYILIFFLFAIAVVLLGAAVTQLLVTSTFMPLRDVERTAARFAAGDYSQRLGGATPNTEVGRLNRSLNTMLARIDRALADRQRGVEQMRRFVGDASHELRTPLVTVRGYAELYRMGAIQKPEDVAQAMERIEKEAIRMGGLVEDLLELARLDEPRELERTPVDLLPIAQDVALDFGVAHPNRTITVQVTEPIAQEAEPEPPTAAIPTAVPTSATGPIALAGALARFRRKPKAALAPVSAQAPELPEVGPIVIGVEDKLRQVVTNLMGNAVRFTPDDSPLEVVVGVDRAGGYGTISIVDHGEGIPPQLREKIFQRFWRADTSRTRETGGSGLGLAIVAGIVAKHEGHVEALETPGGGATFQVSIPLLPRESSEPGSPEADAAPEQATPRS